MINITFEPLLSLATGLKKLRSLGLFDENEYPWSINIFDLEILTNHLESPGVFIHYIENRLKAYVLVVGDGGLVNHHMVEIEGMITP